MYGSVQVEVEVPLVGMKPEEQKPPEKENGAGKGNPDFLQELAPKDKNFWQEVGLRQ